MFIIVIMSKGKLSLIKVTAIIIVIVKWNFMVTIKKFMIGLNFIIIMIKVIKYW